MITFLNVFQHKKKIKCEIPCKESFTFEKRIQSTLDEAIDYRRQIEPCIRPLNKPFREILMQFLESIAVLVE